MWPMHATQMGKGRAARWNVGPLAAAVARRTSYLAAGVADRVRPGAGSSCASLMADDLRPAMAGLELSTKQIQRHMQDLEEGFLKFGADMTALTSHSERLVTQCESLLALSVGTGDAQEQVQGVARLLEEPLRFLQSAAATTHQREEELLGCNGAIQHVLDADTRLAEAVAPLRYIRTMFRTEAARLEVNIQAMFSALTDQMRELQERVEGAFESNYASLRSTQETLAGVSKTLRERSELLESSGSASGQNVTRSQAALIESLQRNEGRTIQLTDVARGIESRVHGMVVAMQTQDIVNQKLQHVLQALDCVRGAYGRFQEAHGGEGAAILATLLQLAQMQDAQLQGAEGDLRAAGDEFGSSCEQVLLHVEELDQRCLLLNEFDEITASADGMVEVLLQSIDEVRDLASDEERMARELLEKVHMMGEMAAPLGQGITDVAEQMRRIALNTQVYAIQMGVGTGLEALSAESVLVAARVAGVSVEVVDSLRKLNELLAKVTRALEERLESAARIAAALGQEGASMQSALHGTRDRILQMLISIGESIEQGKATGERIQAHIHSGAMFSKGLSGARTALQKLSSACEELAHYTATADAQPDQQLLARNYTMVSERQIHERILHAAPGGAAEGIAAEQGTGQLDEDDNIELF